MPPKRLSSSTVSNTSPRKKTVTTTVIRDDDDDDNSSWDSSDGVNSDDYESNEEDEDDEEEEGSDSDPYSAFRSQQLKKLHRKTKEATSSLPSNDASVGIFYKVKMSLPRHKFHRVMCVPVQNTSLSHLHKLLMVAFEWDDGHLHKFETCLGEFTDTSMYSECDEESHCRLDAVLNRGSNGMGYTYDFSSEWDVSIGLEKILKEDEMKQEAQKLNLKIPTDLTKFAFCCGGLGGPVDEESGEMRGKFDIARVNKDLSVFNVWK